MPPASDRRAQGDPSVCAPKGGGGGLASRHASGGDPQRQRACRRAALAHSCLGDPALRHLLPQLPADTRRRGHNASRGCASVGACSAHAKDIACARSWRAAHTAHARHERAHVMYLISRSIRACSACSIVRPRSDWGVGKAAGGGGAGCARSFAAAVRAARVAPSRHGAALATRAHLVGWADWPRTSRARRLPHRVAVSLGSRGSSLHD